MSGFRREPHAEGLECGLPPEAAPPRTVGESRARVASAPRRAVTLSVPILSESFPGEVAAWVLAQAQSRWPTAQIRLEGEE